MALDDRERNFEKALARELRADALNGLHCPDAETLAAYHERMLSPEELVAQKSHIAGCARCQEILATLELTEAVPISERDSEGAVVPVSRGTQPAAGASAAPAAIAAGAKRGSVTSISKRKTYLRWVVPAGAIAAGLLVWVAVKENRAPTMSQSKSVEVAENRDSGKADLGLPKPERREAVPGPSGAEKPSSKLQDNEKQELDALIYGDRAKPVRRARVGNGTGDGRGPSVAQNQMQNSIQSNSIQSKGQNAEQNPASREFDYRVDNNNADKKVSELPPAGRNVAGAMKAENAPRPIEPSMKAKAAPAVSAPAPPAAPNESYGAGAGAAPGRQAKVADADAAAHKDEAVKSMSETVEVTGAAPIVATEQKEMDDRSSAALSKKATQGIVGGLPGNLRNASVAGMQIVATPDPKIFWMVTKEGEVRKSENGGKSSVAQELGWGVKAFAGSAPNATTCWILAQDHVVFRTVDGGRHWSKVSIPSGAGFSTIVATDGEHASISDPLSGLKLATTNGGATWSLVRP